MGLFLVLIIASSTHPLRYSTMIPTHCHLCYPTHTTSTSLPCSSLPTFALPSLSLPTLPDPETQCSQACTLQFNLLRCCIEVSHCRCPRHERRLLGVASVKERHTWCIHRVAHPMHSAPHSTRHASAKSWGSSSHRPRCLVLDIIGFIINALRPCREAEMVRCGVTLA